VGDVRGKGLMIGIEIVENDKNKKPSPDKAKDVVNTAIKRGLLLIQPIGFYNNVIRISPPLCLKKEEALKGFAILSSAIEECMCNK
jgi:4-aminobutyrate aminotransferase-like enzyme